MRFNQGPLIQDGGGGGFSASDSFNRANNPISTGQPAWSPAGSNIPFIVGNQVILGNVGGSIDVNAIWTPSPIFWTSVFSELTYVGQAGGATSVVGPTVLSGGVSQLTRSWYMAAGGNNGGGNDRMWIMKLNPAGGSGILAGPTAISSRVPGTHRLVAVITSTQVVLTYFQNGIQVLTATDANANRLTGGKIGMNVQSGDGVRQQTFDNWIGGSLTGGGGRSTFALHRKKQVFVQ